MDTEIWALDEVTQSLGKITAELPRGIPQTAVLENLIPIL